VGKWAELLHARIVEDEPGTETEPAHEFGDGLGDGLGGFLERLEDPDGEGPGVDSESQSRWDGTTKLSRCGTAPSVVRRMLAKHYRPDDSDSNGPSWLGFLAQTKDSLWSVDLFRCESILLRSHWVMLVMDVFTRRIIGFGVEPADIDGVSVCSMFNHAVAGQHLPKRLSSDHDPPFRFHRWLANLRVLEIEEIKSVPWAPVSHPFVERLIGTIRRKYLDRVFFWNVVDLARKLDDFRTDYNAYRVHRSLGGVTPAQRGGASSPVSANLASYAWKPHCRGLFLTPMPA
jgi:transposase InsO family protein